MWAQAPSCQVARAAPQVGHVWAQELLPKLQEILFLLFCCLRGGVAEPQKDARPSILSRKSRHFQAETQSTLN